MYVSPRGVGRRACVCVFMCARTRAYLWSRRSAAPGELSVCVTGYDGGCCPALGRWPLPVFLRQLHGRQSSAATLSIR